MAVDDLMSRLYPELKRLAAGIFRGERPGHTLQPTALVNEAYLRVFGSNTIDWRDRAHFFAVMARQIRRILVDHGRSTRAAKRGAGVARLNIDEIGDVGVLVNEDIVALDEALAVFEKEEPRAARVVELRYFGGLTESEVGEVLGVSMPTVSRDWQYARTWLFARLRSLDP